MSCGCYAALFLCFNYSPLERALGWCWTVTR